MTFNIGSQNAHHINNVAGDQWNQTTLRDEDVRGQIEELWRALEGARLAPAVTRDVQAQLAAAEEEMTQRSPSKPAVADRLKTATEILVSAGGLAAAGGALLGPLGALAGWLGGLGKPILELLGRNA